MSHPYYHAKSVVNRFGGEIEDTLKYHMLLDSTKIITTNPIHRIILHNKNSIKLFEDAFDKSIILSNNICVTMAEIIKQHVYEDLGKDLFLDIDELASPLLAIKLPVFNTSKANSKIKSLFPDSADSIIAAFSCFPDEWKPLIANSYGPFMIESLLGIMLNNKPVRYMVEKYISAGYGNGIPDASDILGRFKAESYLYKNAKRLSEELNDDEIN